MHILPGEKKGTVLPIPLNVLYRNLILLSKSLFQCKNNCETQRLLNVKYMKHQDIDFHKR